MFALPAVQHACVCVCVYQSGLGVHWCWCGADSGACLPGRWKALKSIRLHLSAVRILQSIWKRSIAKWL